MTFVLENENSESKLEAERSSSKKQENSSKPSERSYKIIFMLEQEEAMPLIATILPKW